MATRVIDDTKLQNIAVAIQGKDSGGTMTVDEMPTRIAAIQTGDEVLFSSDGRQYTRTVEIPNNVTTIGDYAFKGCEHLQTVVIPNSVTSIGEFSFDGDSSLHSINLNGITSCGQYAFRGCIGLENIVAQSLNIIPIGMFGLSSGLISLDIRNASNVNNYAFNRCTSLKYLDIRNATQIGTVILNANTSMEIIDLTSCTTPPTLDHDAFYSVTANWKAVFKDSATKSAVQSATNWSNHASHIYTVAEIESIYGASYGELYQLWFGHPRNEVVL